MLCKKVNLLKRRPPVCVRPSISTSLWGNSIRLRFCRELVCETQGLGGVFSNNRLTRQRPYRTLVISTDPAHSLGDALDQDISGGEPVKVVGLDNLSAMEVSSTSLKVRRPLCSSGSASLPFLRYPTTPRGLYRVIFTGYFTPLQNCLSRPAAVYVQSCVDLPCSAEAYRFIPFQRVIPLELRRRVPQGAGTGILSLSLPRAARINSVAVSMLQIFGNPTSTYFVPRLDQRWIRRRPSRSSKRRYHRSTFRGWPRKWASPPTWLRWVAFLATCIKGSSVWYCILQGLQCYWGLRPSLWLVSSIVLGGVFSFVLSPVGRQAAGAQRSGPRSTAPGTRGVRLGFLSAPTAPISK